MKPTTHTPNIRRACALALLILGTTLGINAADTPLAALAAAKTRPIATVLDKEQTPSADKHDYVSYARYYWPDPDKPDGLPYISRDGDHNNAQVARGDHPRLWTFFSTVETLTAAWTDNHDEAAARRAGEWLRAWLVTPATRMNPNLDYAQVRLGRNNNHGSAAGVIDTRGFGQIANNLAALDNSPALTPDDKKAIRRWFTEYLNWLATAKNGIDERNAKNNHGTWYAAQVLPIARYTRDDTLARQLCDELKQRIASQITPDGKQPEEIRRVDGLHYSLFNLEAYAIAARAALPYGTDLWNYTAPNGASLSRALDFLVPYNTAPSTWPYTQKEKMAPGFLDDLLAERKNATARTVKPEDLLSLDQPDPAREARVAWHHDARFGCFVHWGVYADPAGEWDGRRGGGYSEHIMRQLKIPRQEYLDKIVRPFDPKKFNADTWVRLMHDAGMRYLIITAKHHDGFAMYPSKVSDYNITLTQFPRDRDIMTELSAAGKKYGLKFGFYYSHAFDWEHPDAPGNDWDYNNPGGDKLLHGKNWWENDPQFLTRAQHYVDTKAIPQIKELAENYHPDILWFDTPSKLPPSENRRILAAVRTFAPDTVVNGRILGNYGDYKNTADRPAYFPETKGQWESIPTTNESYGYHRYDHSHKTPAHFIQLLAMTVGKGGNMLLNIGPRGDGTIDPTDANILENLGHWMAKNSESIYGCDRTPLPVQSWGTSTRKGNRLYLHIFDWPKDGRLTVAGLRTDPATLKLLTSGAAIACRRIGPEDIELTLPNTAPDKSDSVIALDFASEPIANKAILITAKRGTTTTLHVMDGELSGKGIAYGDGKRARDVIEAWTNIDATVAWKIRMTAPLRARVAATYNTAKPDDGGTLDITVNGQTLNLAIAPTKNTTDFQTGTLGTLTLQPGEHIITARPQRITGANLARLRQIELTAE